MLDLGLQLAMTLYRRSGSGVWNPLAPVTTYFTPFGTTLGQRAPGYVVRSLDVMEVRGNVLRRCTSVQVDRQVAVCIYHRSFEYNNRYVR